MAAPIYILQRTYLFTDKVRSLSWCQMSLTVYQNLPWTCLGHTPATAWEVPWGQAGCLTPFLCPFDSQPRPWNSLLMLNERQLLCTAPGTEFTARGCSPERHGKTRTSKAKLWKLWPMGQVGPTACFCKACELQRVLTFFNDWEKIKRKIIFYDIWKI